MRAALKPFVFMIMPDSAVDHPRPVYSLNLVKNFIRFLLPVLLLVLLYATSYYNFLLFHVLTEFFSVIVAFAIFMFAWNTRANIENSAFMILGMAYLTIGALDLLHALSYKGMGVFPGSGADTATQLWIAARYVESLSIAGALLLSGRRVPLAWLIVGYGVMTCALIGAILVWPTFPVCYIEGVGLTPFKKISEYVISSILLASLIILWKEKHNFDRRICYLLAGSILVTVMAEVMFTFYISVYGISNLIGHFLKIASFWMIYVAIIQTGLQEPFKLLFRELKESETALRKSQKRYKNLVDNLPTGICEIDADQRIVFLNPAGMHLLDYGEEDIRKGLYLSTVLDKADQAKAQGRMAHLRNGQPIDSTEYHLVRKDGSTTEVVVNTTQATNVEGLPVFQASLTDITERNRLQHRLHQARKMEAVATLAGGMAHEVNNALAGVVGNIELLKIRCRKGALNASDFAKIEVGCDRIAALISKLLAYSRGGRYRAESIEAERFVVAALKVFGARNGPRIHIAWTAEPDLPPIVADPVQLEVVLDGVLSNAVEAIADTGRIDVHIQQWVTPPDAKELQLGMQPGRYLLIRVQDSGKGMDAKTLQRIFEPFYSDKFTGRGLGMAAVYGIIKNHRGWIGIDSSPGVGTKVDIYLPVS